MQSHKTDPPRSPAAGFNVKLNDQAKPISCLNLSPSQWEKADYSAINLAISIAVVVGCELALIDELSSTELRMKPVSPVRTHG